MVGSVLMQRMQDEGDFATINPVFFSTSNAGGAAPAVAGSAGGDAGKLEDAFDVDTLAKLPIIVTAQGGDYTKQVHGELRRLKGLPKPRFAVTDDQARRWFEQNPGIPIVRENFPDSSQPFPGE